MAQLLTIKQSEFSKELNARFEENQSISSLDIFDVFAQALGGDANLLGQEGLKKLIFKQLKEYCSLDETVVAVAKNVSDIKESTQAAITAIDKKDTSSLKSAYAQLKTYQERILELEQSVYTDEVTGVKNRKYLVNHELHDENFKYKGRLMHIRVNNFPEINREQGNEAGDAVLKFVSNVLEKHLRTVGIHLIRYMGVEFIALSKEAVSARVYKLFEETVNLILSKKFKTHNGEVLNIELEFSATQFEKEQSFQEVYKQL